jgi:hypothetical protein
MDNHHQSIPLGKAKGGMKLLSMRMNTLIRIAGFTCLLPLAGYSQAASDDIPDLDGMWTFGQCPGGRFLGCMTLQEDDPKLTERALAYQAAFDEMAQPKYDCAPMPIPHMYTDPYNYRLEQLEDRVRIYYGKDDVVRTIWLEGHGHPVPAINEFLYFGHAIGKYEDGALVVTTNKFTFDPQGLNADFRIPSSTQKELTERFSRDGDDLVLEVSTVDTFFLKEPWTFSVRSTPATSMGDEWTCELDGARRSLMFEISKYPEDPEAERIKY